MAAHDDPWVDGTLAARLTKLWNERDADGGTISTAAIGRQLGVSKNAVVGKAHRMDLPARPSPIVKKGQPKRYPAIRAGKITLPSLAATVVFPQPVPTATVHVPTRKRALTVVTKPKPAPVVESTRVAAAPKPYGRIIECCWPIGVPGTKAFGFCGHPSQPGKVYCEDHCHIAFRPLRDLREDAA